MWSSPPALICSRRVQLLGERQPHLVLPPGEGGISGVCALWLFVLTTWTRWKTRHQFQFSILNYDHSFSSDWHAASPRASFMNCPYHALSKFLRGTHLRHRESWNSGFMGPFEDTRHLYCSRSLYLSPPPLHFCQAKVSRLL